VARYRRVARPLIATAAGTALVASLLGGVATARPPVEPDAPKQPVAVGSGGAVASVDGVASQVGLDVLADGGNAADAAVATAAALGVTEPYSAGIGGGGFLVYYDAESGEVSTIDGRETAPASYEGDTFLGEDGEPLDFWSVVNSGMSIGVPGTPALWDEAARELGSQPLGDLLYPAEQIARNGFVVDETFSEQTESNADRFSMFPATAEVYLPGGEVPQAGDVFRNPDLARAYRQLRVRGVDELYQGRMGRAIAAEASDPTTADDVEVFAGEMTVDDVRGYEALWREPTRSEYRGTEVYGMAPPSSGGHSVGEALNLFESYDEMTGESLSDVDQVQYLHRIAEASATAFADRNRWSGDVPDVPVEGLLSQEFADHRACQVFDDAVAAERPIAYGDPSGPLDCGEPAGTWGPVSEDHGTTHLTVADQWGNVAAYTLTIEQTGGSGITVPGYGFLLNNELTDFDFEPEINGIPAPNRPGSGKRPRSSMAPTIVVEDGEPIVAAGTPGGTTIITTVIQMLAGTLDRDMSLGDALAAPRISSRNTAASAEPAIVDSATGEALAEMGHDLSTSTEIGAASGIRMLGDGRFEAAAEPERRGGGSARVIDPD